MCSFSPSCLDPVDLPYFLLCVCVCVYGLVDGALPSVSIAPRALTPTLKKYARFPCGCRCLLLLNVLLMHVTYVCRGAKNDADRAAIADIIGIEAPV